MSLQALKTSEVSVLIWPSGQVEQFPRGTTAGYLLRDKGILQGGEGPQEAGGQAGMLVNVNSRLVPESTVLRDGDLVMPAMLPRSNASSLKKQTI